MTVVKTNRFTNFRGDEKVSMVPTVHTGRTAQMFFLPLNVTFDMGVGDFSAAVGYFSHSHVGSPPSWGF